MNPIKITLKIQSLNLRGYFFCFNDIMALKEYVYTFFLRRINNMDLNISGLVAALLSFYGVHSFNQYKKKK